MKRVYLIFACIIWLVSCRSGKETMSPLDIKIKSITGVGEIIYEGDLIKSIGRQQFIYNTNKELIACRMYYRGTDFIGFPSGDRQTIVTETVERYSYLRQGKLVKAELIDSVYSVTYYNDQIQNQRLLTNQPAYEYYHTGNRLDSIIKRSGFGSLSAGKVIFEYDAAGNIKREKTYENTDYPAAYPGIPYYIPITESITVYEYDNKINPFKILYDKYGVVIDFYKGKGLQNYWNKVHSNISVNNPVRMEATIKIDEITLRANTQIKYEYNAKGLPVKITYETTGQPSRTIDISYY